MTRTGRAGARRALVIEDDVDVRHLLRSYLSRLGWAVEECGTGEHGLEAARRTPPDLVVLDLMLPGISGHEVLAALRSDPAMPGVTVVVSSVLDRHDQLALPADAVLPKPFSRADLQAVLTRIGS
ncbi:MAG: response regulator transcription factor [Actinomycetes bacterium]